MATIVNPNPTPAYMGARGPNLDYTGTVPTLTSGSITVIPGGSGVRRQDILVCTNVPITYADGGGTLGNTAATLVYTLPKGLVDISSGNVTITAFTATTGIADSSTSGIFGLGTSVALTSTLTLATTQQNIVPSTSLGSLNTSKSITATAKAFTATRTGLIDGTATAVPIYLNSKFDATDSTAASTATFTGIIVVNWSLECKLFAISDT